MEVEVDEETPDSWRRELDAWSKHQRAAGMARGSMELRRHHLERLARWASRGPYDLTTDDLLEWLASHDWGRETRRSVRTSLRTFYAWAVRAGRTSTNPADDLPTVRPNPPRPHPTPNDAYRRALARADDRERVMLRLAGECGLRRAEVARVHRRDVVEDVGGWWLMVHGKGDRDRLVPLPASLAIEVRRLCMAGAGYAFPGDDDGHLSPRWVGKVIGRLLPDGYTMHSLRHRGATKFYEQSGGDLLLTQQLLGHASPTTTQLYVAVDRAKLRAVVDKVANG